MLVDDFKLGRGGGRGLPASRCGIAGVSAEYDEEGMGSGLRGGRLGTLGVGRSCGFGGGKGLCILDRSRRNKVMVFLLHQE